MIKPKSPLVVLLFFMVAGGFACSETATSPERSMIRLESGTFDPEKPTLVFFGGGNCLNSWVGTESWENEETLGDAWFENANVFSFYYYEFDQGSTDTTYYNCAKIVVDTLKVLAPNYSQNIQACGFSTGGTPALDLGIYINTLAAEVPYQVTQVTLMDSPCFDYAERIKAYNKSSSKSDPRLIINLLGALSSKENTYSNVLNASIVDGHDEVFWWYVNSLQLTNANTYNNGRTAGAYWSILGEGNNLSLANSLAGYSYLIDWEGDLANGSFTLTDDTNGFTPLPAPFQLTEPELAENRKSVLLSCEPSTNAVSYQLFLGPAKDKLAPYGEQTISPPKQFVNLSSKEMYWTIVAANADSITIHPDPIQLRVPE